MIPLAMKMADVLLQRVTQHVFSEEDHSVQALLTQASPESLQVSVKIGRSRWQAYRLYARVAQSIAEGLAELAVAVHQDITLAGQESFIGSRQIPSHLFHPT